MAPSSTDPVAFACAVKRAFPAIPSREALAIAVVVCTRGRGRVSNTARGQTLAREAIARAVENHVRHGHTAYDALLRRHGDRALARAQIHADVHAVLHAWRTPSREPPPPACRSCWQARALTRRRLERPTDAASAQGPRAA